MADEWLDRTVERELPGDEEPAPPTGDYTAVSSERAQLVVLAGEAQGRTYVVVDELLVGRSADAGVRLDGDDVSRRHAHLYRSDEGEFWIEDLGSRNGTQVNGFPVTQRLLRFGDKIRIGLRTVLLFTHFDRLEDQLLQSQKLEAVGQLAGGVAHDFNNLLGAVLANVSFLHDLGPEVTFADADVRACLSDLELAARRATDLVQRLVGFARPGKREDLPTDLGALVAEVAALVRRTFERAVEVEASSEDDVRVRGDRGQLYQLLMNLCLNARDAMVRGGTLTLRVERVNVPLGSAEHPLALPAGHYARVTVRDTGSGMDEQLQRRIFEPFFTTKAPGKGTGLGLATVYAIVTHHGGRVDVQSAPGKGSTFRVYLPLLVQTPKEVEVEARPASAGPETRRLRGVVLLVDDDEVLRNSTARLLRAQGYAVITAGDGREGVEAYRAQTDLIGVVLLDLDMPVMDGLQALRELRRDDPSVRVVICSGKMNAPGKDQLLAAGAAGVLPKPFDGPTLLEALEAAQR
ncbi:MAG: response regulator [Deltaproteobacteria bacterium]|nr:response regulator [Deltaproteobacteria bacterium]